MFGFLQNTKRAAQSEEQSEVVNRYYLLMVHGPCRGVRSFTLVKVDTYDFILCEYACVS